MADAYWSYGGARYQAPAAPGPVKRPRTDYGEVPGGLELGGYYPHDEERVVHVHRGGRENEALGASYDRYMQNGPVSSYGGSESARSGRHPIDDGRMMGVRGTNGRTAEYGGGRREKSLPPDASSTLFVEGLSANCTRREVSHVFRPFPGFREVRLVNKESRHAGGDPWVLCFVDFSTPSQAAVALDCLQEVPGGLELGGYYPHDEERVVHVHRGENEALGASYDRYMQNGPVSSYGGSESARSGRHPIDDGRMMGVRGTNGRTAEYGGGRREKSLPPDASSTLFVEGLSANCTHVFRPFPGFQEARLVNKESRHAGGDPWVLCFVDFSTPSQAAVALDCLQGYKFDEHDRDSPSLRLQFSRFPGPRSAGEPRGRH